MSLFRCIRLLSGKNRTIPNVFKHSCVYYSSDKNPSDNDIKQDCDEKQGNQSKSESKSLPPKTQNRLNDLLKRLSSRSSLNIVKEVKLSKPLGYTQLRLNKQVDGEPTKPRNIRAAVKAVSTELGDKGVETEILSQLSEKGDIIDDIISTMKPEKKYQPRVGTFKENGDRPVRYDKYYDQSRRRTPITRNENESKMQQIELTNFKQNPFDGEPIGIFMIPGSLKTNEDSLKTWQKLEKYDLHAAMSTAPRNYFEKMAYWTEEGKIWRFPIDNEQGLDEEHQTSFTEHVFLEEHLEPWCPKKGALRNFMELVCIGLSKNPYYTVQQKREHIEWYRNYFHEKQHILQRVIEANSQSVTVQVIDGTKST